MSERQSKNHPLEQSLQGRKVALPENRRLSVLAELLRRRGAEVLEVPMVAILDAPDPEPVAEWLKDFIADPPELFIILTGEGLRRLLSLAAKRQLRTAFVTALARVTKLCRGPKPVNALREVGLKAELQAEFPTTEGVIASLGKMALENRRVAVQLYGEEPNVKLTDYLRSRGADVCTVAPYIYAGQSDAGRVLALIKSMAVGGIDVIAFTSKPQFSRLQSVAKQYGCEQELLAGLAATQVATVGPVVRDQLLAAGVRVDIMPERTFFMKPMVSAIAKYLLSQ